MYGYGYYVSISEGRLKFFFRVNFPHAYVIFLYPLLEVKLLYWFLLEISLSFLCFLKRLVFISFQICPICSTSVGDNMVGHITMQHGDVFNISFCFHCLHIVKFPQFFKALNCLFEVFCSVSCLYPWHA